MLAIGAYHPDHIQRIKHAIEAHLKNPDFNIYDLHPRNAQPPQRRRPPSGTGNRQHHGSQRDAGRSTLQRLADALGWDRVPTLTPEQEREADREFNVAQAQARRLYGLESERFERGWDAALDLAIELVRTARDGHDAQHRLRQLTRQVRTNQEPE